jgi:hypothetical protein
MDTFITGLVSGCVGMFFGAVLMNSQFKNEYSCTESAIVNGVAECVEYRRKEK